MDAFKWRGFSLVLFILMSALTARTLLNLKSQDAELILSELPYDSSVHNRFSWTGRYNQQTKRTEVRLLLDGRTIEVNHRAARKCLANISMAFVGDSIMRFQYINLAYFMTTGLWEARPSTPSNEKLELSHNWTDYYILTNSRLTSSHTSAICDCHRTGITQANPSSLENRFWTSVDGTTLSYFSLVEIYRGIQFHTMEWLAPCFAPGKVPCAQQGCVVGSCLDSNSSLAQLHFSDAMAHIVQLVKPDILVLNQGAWTLFSDKVPDFTLAHDQVVQELNMLVRKMTSLYSKTKLWLKSTLPILSVWRNDHSAFYIREQVIFASVENATSFNPRPLLQMLQDEIDVGKHDAWVPILNRSFAVFYDGLHLHTYGNRAVNEAFLLQAFAKTCPQMFSRGHGAWKHNASEVATEFALY